MRKTIFILVFLPFILNAQNSITFQVEELERPKELLREKEISKVFEDIIEKYMDVSDYDRRNRTFDYSPVIYSQSHDKDSLVLSEDVFHPFFGGMYQAYADHRPFILSPDVVWLLIAQGFGQHVNNNAEQLRHHFVNHEGKSSLVVQVGSTFDLKSREDWETIFPQFADKIGKEVGKELADNMVCDFTTTTITTQVASEVVLMETMKSYFEYIVLMIVCGIPEITLEGTPEDWQKVADKANYLRKYELDWWIDEIEPLLKEFVKTSKGEIDKTFWMNMFKQHTAKRCGDTGYFDGWIVKFFPYNKQRERNDLQRIKKWDQLPKEIVNVDVRFIQTDDNGNTKEIPLEVWAGFIGLKQDKDTYALKPEIGWMIVEKDEALVSKLRKKQYESWSKDPFGGINIRVETVPKELLDLKKIVHLSIEFIDGIKIPDEMKDIEIERLELKGRISPEEKERIRNMFPNTYLIINRQAYYEGKVAN